MRAGKEAGRSATVPPASIACSTHAAHVGATTDHPRRPRSGAADGRTAGAIRPVGQGARFGSRIGGCGALCALQGNGKVREAATAHLETALAAAGRRRSCGARPPGRGTRVRWDCCRGWFGSRTTSARVPGAEPEGPAADAPCSTRPRGASVSFRSRVGVRDLLEARHVVLRRRPDEVVLKATGSGTGLVKDRARRGRRITRVLGPRVARGR